MKTDRVAQLFETMSRDPALLSEFVALAARYGIDLENDELSEGDLDKVAGGIEEQNMRLQAYVDRLSASASTVSQILKKQSDTASSITQNLK